MKFSIITVCLNCISTIEKAIKSVISQDYKELEYIIIDGGSTDGTREMIQQYERFLAHWVSGPDQGIFDAMNKGIGLASGDVIAFLNSDDWYVDGAVRCVAETFAAQNCDIVCGNNYVIRKDGTSYYYDASGRPFDDMFINMIYYHSAVFAKKEYFRKDRNFDTWYKMAADYDWMLRAMKQGAKLYHIEKPLFYFCYGGISSVNEIACAREAKQIARKHLPAEKEALRPRIDERFQQVVINVSLEKRKEKILEGDLEYLKQELSFLFSEEAPVYIWGAGKLGKECIQWFSSAGIQMAGIIDSDCRKWGSSLCGILVSDPEKLAKEGKCKVIISTEIYKDEILRRLQEWDRRDEMEIYTVKEIQAMIAERDWMQGE